jgi:hypothetical protein
MHACTTRTHKHDIRETEKQIMCVCVCVYIYIHVCMYVGFGRNSSPRTPWFSVLPNPCSSCRPSLGTEANFDSDCHERGQLHEHFSQDRDCSQGHEHGHFSSKCLASLYITHIQLRVLCFTWHELTLTLALPYLIQVIKARSLNGAWVRVTVTVAVTGNSLNTEVLTLVSRHLSQPVQSPSDMRCRPPGTRQGP